MTVRYVGIGGSDGADGLSWANRKLTLNGVEDTPVAAADIIYVGPGVYRQLLTCDVSGSAGNIITYIADVTGENTDGIGGIVRVTGSDNDTTAARARCIDASATARDYRTFRGFAFDLVSTECVGILGGRDWVIEDCSFEGGSVAEGVTVTGASQLNITVRRCYFVMLSSGINFTHTGATTDTNGLVENCIFLGPSTQGIRINLVGDILIRNCIVFAGRDDGFDVVAGAGTGAGEIVTVNNCILCALDGFCFEAAVMGEMIENFNVTFMSGGTRSNVATGANSVDGIPPLFAKPLLSSGVRMPPPLFPQLSQWSSLALKTGTGEAADDIFGIARPATSSKNSWGPVQFQEYLRDVTSLGGTPAEIKLTDDGEFQMFMPHDAASTTVAVDVWREAGYTGTNPQLIIRQPDQTDDTTTDAGSTATWNTLSTTLTPATAPGFVVIVLRSNSTATAGSGEVWFKNLVVS